MGLSSKKKTAWMTPSSGEFMLIYADLHGMAMFFSEGIMLELLDKNCQTELKTFN